MSSFLLVTCHVGAERVLRRAVPLALDGARPAFARPGLVTFKLERALPLDIDRPHPLVRAWGLSLGQAATPSEVAVALTAIDGRPHLQVSPGSAGPPGQVSAALAEVWATAARRVAEQLHGLGAPGAPEVGAAVVDVIVRPDEPWRLAWHTHGHRRGPLAQGAWAHQAPPDAPSRAWAKLEELIAWSGLTPRPGERALEIGCAPGGATVNLLDRGLQVVGVDPQPMTLPERVEHSPFVHLTRPIEGVPREELPDEVHWIVLDSSVAAPVALRSLQRLTKRYRSTLRGVFATLKLNDWDLVDRAPEWVAQVREWGLEPIGPANLPSFRQEVGLVAVAHP